MKRNTDAKIIETFANDEYVSLQRLEGKQVKSFFVEQICEDTRAFDYNTYTHEIHSPVIIDLGEPFPSFDKDREALPRCLDMPIRLAGESEYRLPTKWESIREDIEKIITIEERHNPNWKDYYTYITVDCNPVTVGNQQRHGGLHVDGFQGERITNKTKITRNYVGTNNGGTQFWEQSFIVADPEKFNVFKGFDLQADGIPFVAVPNYFYFMDAYTVHESGFAEYDGDRTFFRITYDLKKFDRLGNTHNPNLDYEWEMVDRNAQDLVTEPRLTDILASPYFPYAK